MAYGRVAEWFKAAVLKTARGFTLPRGFESHPFRQLARPPSFANSRRGSFLSRKPRYFNVFTSVLRSACDRLGSSTAGAVGWVRGWVGEVRFYFCLAGNRTHDAKDSPALRGKGHQYKAARYVR